MFNKLVTSFFAITLTSFLAQGASNVAHSPTLKEVTVGISDVYVPGGFDSEADSYVVVSGIFPNGCYQWKGGEVTSPTTFTHEIRSIASVSQGMCTMALIPFAKEIRIGKLETGDHTLRFVNGDGTYLERVLTIE